MTSHNLEQRAEIAFSALLPHVQQYFREMGLVPHFITRPYEERRTTPETVAGIRAEIDALCGATGSMRGYDSVAHHNALSYFGMMIR
jgi:hypothetical protein